MIGTVILYTNGTILIFDKEGNPCGDLCAICAQPNARQKYYTEREAYIRLLAEIYKAKPTILISEWGKWEHELAYGNFLLLLGEQELYKEVMKCEDEISALEALENAN